MRAPPVRAVKTDKNKEDGASDCLATDVYLKEIAGAAGV
jgi:hypothetical protein